MIILQKRCGRHVWEDLDDYRLITLLTTELKILARVLANLLQPVISDLIVPEQNYAVKERSIQNNLHLVREIIEWLEDDAEASLINLDQSRPNLETAGFETGFRKWISMMYHNPQVVVQVNGKCSKAFTIKQSVRQGYPCPLFSISSLWSPRSLGLRMRVLIQSCVESL